MRFLKDLLTDKTVLTVLGFFAAAASLLLLSSLLKFSVLWVLAALAVMIVAWLVVDFRRKRQVRRSGDALGDMLEQQATRTLTLQAPARAPETTALRERMLEAIKTIKSSKLGESSGAAALYELPWYLVIGQPADGKRRLAVRAAQPRVGAGAQHRDKGLGAAAGVAGAVERAPADAAAEPARADALAALLCAVARRMDG